MDSNEGELRSQRKQWLAALAVTFPMITVGTLEIVVQFYMKELFRRKDIPVELMTWADVSTSFGIVIGAIFGALTADIFGRKRALFGTTVSALNGIIGMSSASSIGYFTILLIAGIHAGIACTVVPLYISEIADRKIRGNLLMLQLLGVYTGQLIVASIATWMEYGRILSAVSIIIPVLFVITVWWLPETPYYLASKNQYEAAAKSLAFFKGISEFAGRRELEDDIGAVEKDSNRQETCQKIRQLFRGQNRKGLFIILLLILVQWNRTYVNVRHDVADALKNIAPISNNNSRIILSVTQLMWSGVLVFTIDAIGRRYYLLGSTLGGLIITIFSVAMIMDRSYLLFFTKFILYLCQIVIFGVPLVFVGELFLDNVKSIASATVMIFGTIIKVIIAFIHIAVYELEFHDYYFLIPMYLIVFVFVLAFVPETKKKDILRDSE